MDLDKEGALEVLQSLLAGVDRELDMADRARSVICTRRDALLRKVEVARRLKAARLERKMEAR